MFIAAASLTACAPLVRAPAPPTPTPALPPAQQQAPVGGQAGIDYTIDPVRTAVTVIVRRAGPFARLGHDHVITSGEESGLVRIGDSPEHSGFEIRLPVDKFEVDLPEARAAAGAEFAAAVPESARAGTRQNMLRPEVLDGAQFPTLTLRAESATGTWADCVAVIAVTMKGRETQISVPLQAEVGPEIVTARGSLVLRQSELGLQPFSVAGGAVQVADPLEIRFVIAAAKAP